MSERVIGKAGKYDEVAIRVIAETNATAVAVVVVDGAKGHGFSVSAMEGAVSQVHTALPAMLRMVADAIEGGARPDGLRVTKPGESPSN